MDVGLEWPTCHMVNVSLNRRDFEASVTWMSHMRKRFKKYHVSDLEDNRSWFSRDFLNRPDPISENDNEVDDGGIFTDGYMM